MKKLYILLFISLLFTLSACNTNNIDKEESQISQNSIFDNRLESALDTSTDSIEIVDTFVQSTINNDITLNNTHIKFKTANTELKKFNDFLISDRRNTSIVTLLFITNSNISENSIYNYISQSVFWNVNASDISMNIDKNETLEDNTKVQLGTINMIYKDSQYNNKSGKLKYKLFTKKLNNKYITWICIDNTINEFYNAEENDYSLYADIIYKTIE